MVERHADVLALYGFWIGLALLVGSFAPMLVLGFASGTTIAAGMYVLVGVVFAGQGAVLCSSAERYVGRHLVPPPLEWVSLDNRPAVYVVGALALVLGASFLWLGGEILWLFSHLAAR